MIIQEIFPGERTLDINSTSTDFVAASSWYPRILGTRFNFVLKTNHSTTVNSDAVSNEIDRFFLKLIRFQSDLIITTGETARSENLRASRHAPLAIITRNPNSLSIPATNTTSELPVIICSTEHLQTHYLNRSLSHLHLHALDFSAAVSEVIDNLEAESVVVETGLSAAAMLFDTDMIDEICLTVVEAENHQSASNSAKSFCNDFRIQTELIQVLVSESTFLFRFKVLK